MTQVLDPQQIAERRAMKRLKSEGYAKMPSEKVLEQAAKIEMIRASGIDKSDTAIAQRLQIVNNVLAHHVEVQKEKLEPRAKGYMEMVETCIAFTITLAKQGIELMENRGKEFEVPDEEEEEDSLQTME